MVFAWRHKKADLQKLGHMAKFAPILKRAREYPAAQTAHRTTYFALHFVLHFAGQCD